MCCITCACIGCYSGGWHITAWTRDNSHQSASRLLVPRAGMEGGSGQQCGDTEDTARTSLSSRVSTSVVALGVLAAVHAHPICLNGIFAGSGLRSLRHFMRLGPAAP